MNTVIPQEAIAGQSSRHWSDAFLQAFGADAPQSVQDLDYEYIWSAMFIRASDEAKALATNRTMPAFGRRLTRLQALIGELDANCPEIGDLGFAFNVANGMNLTVQFRDIPTLLRSLADGARKPSN